MDIQESEEIIIRRVACLAKFFVCSVENWSLVGSGDITLTVRAIHRL